MRQLHHISEISRRYPKAWKLTEMFREDPPEPWPEWCFLPLAGAYAIVSGGGSNRVSIDDATDIAAVAALAAWRMTQGIYRFDEELFEELWKTPVAGEIPVDVLMHLPEWCVYIETPDREQHGFYAHLEYDVNDGRQELRILCDEEKGLTAVPIHLKPGGTLRSGLDDAVSEAYSAAGQMGVTLPAGSLHLETDRIESLVSLLLYLCSSAAEYRDLKGTERQPENPRPKRTKKGVRTLPADGPTVWETGWRIGPALRRAREELERGAETGSDRRGPRPHIRRAHWHLYWTGPRDEEQTPLLKWLPPIPVKLDSGEIVPTIRKVE